MRNSKVDEDGMYPVRYYTNASRRAVKALMRSYVNTFSTGSEICEEIYENKITKKTKKTKKNSKKEL